MLFLSLLTPLDPACFTPYSASQDNSHSRHNSILTGGRDESEGDDVSSDEEGDGSEKDSDDSDDNTQRAKRELAEVPFGVLQVRPQAAAISSQQIRISTCNADAGRSKNTGAAKGWNAWEAREVSSKRLQGQLGWQSSSQGRACRDGQQKACVAIPRCEIAFPCQPYCVYFSVCLSHLFPV